MARILSIDGGGIKGVFAASFLKEIEEKCNIRICDYFDMITGTSTGGIIAAALSIGIPAEQILNLYLEKANIIFPEKRNVLMKLIGPQYSSEPLMLELKKIFGEKRIGDCLTRLIIPSFNIEEQKPRVFKTAHAEDLLFDYENLLVDCIMATTAAPTYLKPHSMHGGVFVDGGLGANNPSVIAVIEGMTRCKWNKEEMKVLSIGGVEQPNWATRGTEQMGLVNALKILNIYMNAECQYSENITRLLIGNDNYLRINHRASQNQVALDKVDKTSLKLLQNWGRNQAQSNLSVIQEKFIKEKKIDFIPHRK